MFTFKKKCAFLKPGEHCDFPPVGDPHTVGPGAHHPRARALTALGSSSCLGLSQVSRLFLTPLIRSEHICYPAHPLISDTDTAGPQLSSHSRLHATSCPSSQTSVPIIVPPPKSSTAFLANSAVLFNTARGKRSNQLPSKRSTQNRQVLTAPAPFS